MKIKKYINEKIEIIKSKIDAKFIKKAKITSFVVGAFLLILVLAYTWYSFSYNERIYPNVAIGEIDFSGLSKMQAQDLIKNTINKHEDNKLVFTLEDKNWTLEIKDIKLKYILDETIEKLYSVGRSDDFWSNVKQRVALLFKTKNIYSIYDYEQIGLNSFLSKIFDEMETKVIDANFVYEDEKINISEEKEGKAIDKSKLYADIQNQLSSFQYDKDIKLVLNIVKPAVTASDLEKLANKIQRAIIDQIVMESEIRNIDIGKDSIFKWIDVISVEKPSNKTAFWKKVFAQDQINIDLEVNEEKILLFIDSISKDINKDSQDARLSFSDGKVSVFQSPEKGYKVDTQKTSKELAQLIYSRMNVAGIDSEKSTDAKLNKLAISLEVTDPDVSDKNIDELGIKEQISTGSTSFAGSPNNRIFNIKHGAELFNGVIIKPGEALSAISIIGNPSAETGYLPELVIKGNKTTPEYGGGLCQVSTTLFRAALNAGLEIIERTNHFYRVSYYEPPVGMDATVYYPKPDLVIKNNTPAYILIQTSVVGNTITFSMYGTKDGRTVEISDPVMYDHVNPPEPKYIDTDSLPSGELKRIESAHPGVKAQFNYKVIVDGKAVIDTIFRSNYVAWQAVYQRGTGGESSEEQHEEEQHDDPAPEPTPTPTPSSTPTPTPSTTP